MRRIETVGFRTFRARRAVVILLALVLTAGMEANAQPFPVRLSTWLKGQELPPESYLPGLMWQVPGEEARQAQQLAGLQTDIQTEVEAGAGRQAVLEWLARLPVTGRVPVAIADADWLAANPAHDPVLFAHHRVMVPERPATVAVLVSNGKRCMPAHQSGSRSMAYVRACLGETAAQADWVWLVQPDGKTARYGVARWNEGGQDEVAPGAWIWVPLRGDDWPDAVSDGLARVLAMQGVAMPGLVEANTASGGVVPRRAEDAAEGLTITANDWGGAGLMQTPSARMRVTGHGSLTYTQTDPYEHISFFLQPMEWLETGFRYTSVINRLYGPAIAGNQPYKDKSIDVKVRLLEESRYMPALALGLRDITGTGLFSGEYVVAGKRYGRADWSLGMGWGYVGGRGNYSNPLSVLGKKFDTRVKDVGMGGNLALTSYFRGPVSIFGGVQYQTGWAPLVLKLEYDGNDYQHEPKDNFLRQDTPWNIGVVYRASNGWEAMLGVERGNLLTFALTMQTDLKKLAMPKYADPSPVPVTGMMTPGVVPGKQTAQEIERQTSWNVGSISRSGNRLSVVVRNGGGAYWQDRLDRANAVLQRDAGSEIDLFSYVQRQSGVEVVEQVVDRRQWLADRLQPLPPSEQKEPVTARAATPRGNDEALLFSDPGRLLEWEPGFGLQYNLGGPDGFLLYQFHANAKARLNLREDTWVQGMVQLGLVDNYDKFKYTAPSKLPRVRTYLKEYMTRSDVLMPNLQLTHVGQLSENQFYSVYGGYLEWMFAGAGAEWLYRPVDSRWAFGVDVNRVRQRGFKQDFELRKYRVDTGHATLYWDTGWNDVLVNLSAGQYLAGDKGVTVGMARVFQNGVRFGGYFTKTNVSAKQFGEGSFDKALYVTIPFEAMLTRSNNKYAAFVYKPLIRDGGAKLTREVMLYDVTRLRDRRALQYRPPELEDHIPVPSRREPEWGWDD
jgi:hypothetical protein